MLIRVVEHTHWTLIGLAQTERESIQALETKLEAIEKLRKPSASTSPGTNREPDIKDLQANLQQLISQVKAWVKAEKANPYELFIANFR